MADFATSMELQNWLELDAINSAKANLALEVASSEIRSHCGWSISEETATLVLDGSGARTLWLPTLRLTAVTSVKVNGDPLTVDTQYDWTSYGKLIHRGCWPRKPRSVEVSFTHGYDEVPAVVKGVCLALAGRAYDNARGARAKTDTAGPFTESVSYMVTGGLSDLELKKLGPFTIEHVG